MRDDFYTRFGKKRQNSDWQNQDRGYKRWHTPEPDTQITDEEKRAAKRAFSRVGLALFTFTAASFAVILITYLAIFLFFRNKMEAITSDIYFSWIMNAVSMYLVAFPALYLVLRSMKCIHRPKSKLGLDEFVLLFFISKCVMMAGNLIGVNINNFLGILLGREIANDVSALISDSPLWLIVLIVVIVGPIVEELIFRKLIIDRLSVFGDMTAVLISSLAFGLFHGNLYQLFYAAGLGFILGYIYTKTRNILYPTVMHMIINLSGSVAVLPIAEMLTEFEQMSQILASGADIDYSKFILIINAILTYVILEYGMAIAGAVILIKKLTSHSLYISNKADLPLPRKKAVALVTLNTGMILFLAVSVLQIAINIFAA